MELDQLLPGAFAAEGAVSAETRPGYSGYQVAPDRLVEVATALRDQGGYSYLSAATAVDYPDKNAVEMVYHLYRPTGGPGAVLHVQAPRDAAVLPSLVPVYPGAEFQEREAWDLMGIRFTGHPNLKRLLLWEGFEGHPLRRDYL